MLVLQGSRRSGRTTVANATALGAALSGLQTLLVCPAPELARHSFEAIKKVAGKNPVAVSPAKATIEFRSASIKVLDPRVITSHIRENSFDLAILDCAELGDEEMGELKLVAKQILQIPESYDTDGAL